MNDTTEAAIALASAASPVYPAGFGTGVWAGVLYTNSLFSLMLAATLSVATVFRFAELNRQQGCTIDSPLASQRRIVSILLLGICMCATPAMFELLLWNKVSSEALGWVVTSRRVAQALLGWFVLAAVCHGYITARLRSFAAFRSDKPILLRRGLCNTGRSGNDPNSALRSIIDTGLTATADFKAAWPHPLLVAPIVLTCFVLSVISAVATAYSLG